MTPRRLGVTLLLVSACRGTPPGAAQDDEITRLVDSLRPAVEQATRLSFRGPTRSALKSREEIREYLLTRLEEDFPPEREEGITAIYRLLGLVPDSVDLKSLLLDLYTEQIAGFYDPMTSTLYGVRGADPAQLRLVLAHELVHALQHQYLPLDSIMKAGLGQADRQSAAQAVFEGQATLASIRVLVPGQDVTANPQFWQVFRDQIKTQQTAMQVFARAPLALREELLFPYLNGAEFMRWWDETKPEQPLPTLATLPRSTEQILHPSRYSAGDQPLALRLADSTGDVLYEDTLGELELQIVATVLRGGGEVLTSTPAGWAGDRIRVYRSPAGPAVVWYLVWDDAAGAARFEGTSGTRLLARPRAGYRTTVERVNDAARPTTRVVIAPEGWQRWTALPAVLLP